MTHSFKKIALVSLDTAEIERHFKELCGAIDKTYKEVDSTADPLLKAKDAAIPEIRAVLDLIEGIRSDAYVYRVKIKRIHDTLSNEYNDGIRKDLSSANTTVLGRAPTLEERRAEIETRHFDSFNRVRVLSRCVDEVTSLVEYLKFKERWLRDVRFELVENERNLRYFSGSDYSS